MTFATAAAATAGEPSTRAPARSSSARCSTTALRRDRAVPAGHRRCSAGRRRGCSSTPASRRRFPTHHPYIANYLAHQKRADAGWATRCASPSRTRRAAIYDANYLDTLRKLSDEVFLLPGVARNQMKSLWTPTTRWVGVTEEGLEGGPVIPDGYDGSADEPAAAARQHRALGRDRPARRARREVERDLRAAAGQRRRRPAAGLRRASPSASRRCARSTKRRACRSTSPASPRSSAT